MGNSRILLPEIGKYKMAEWVPKEYEKTWNDAKASYIKAYGKEPKNEKEWQQLHPYIKKWVAKWNQKLKNWQSHFY